MAFRRFHKISYILDAYKSQDVHCCYNAREAILLRRAATTAGKVVPHAPKETSLGLLVVQTLATGHVDGVAAALLGHQALKGRTGAATTA